MIKHTMGNINRNISITLFWLVSLALYSCTVDSFDQNRAALTAYEALIAGHIIGESISENQNGLLSTFPEAFAIPTGRIIIDRNTTVCGSSPITPPGLSRTPQDTLQPFFDG